MKKSLILVKKTLFCLKPEKIVISGQKIKEKVSCAISDGHKTFWECLVDFEIFSVEGFEGLCSEGVSRHIMYVYSSTN